MEPRRSDLGDDRLVKASLARVAALGVVAVESVDVLWNPARYRVHRRARLEAPRRTVGGRPVQAMPHAGAREEVFETELFIDTTDEQPGPLRDARRHVERLSSWMATAVDGAAPAEVVFVWGPFRFAGFVDTLDEEWIRFDPDGTPVRAWVTLVLRRWS